MARELKYTVLVDDEVLPAGTTDDHKLAKKITNPAVWTAEEDSSTAAPAKAPAKKAAKKAQPRAASKPPESEGGQPATPPAVGDRPADDADDAAWAAYATALGQDVPDGADRAAIVAQLEDAGLLDGQ
jgi:hypothetical protein